MKIEDSFCSLEQAKKLKELGMVQNSPFMYAILKVEYDESEYPGGPDKFTDQPALVADFEDDGNWTLISELDSELLKEAICNGSDLEDFDSKETFAAISSSEIGIVAPLISRRLVYIHQLNSWYDKNADRYFERESIARAQILIDDLEHGKYCVTNIKRLNEALKS